MKGQVLQSQTPSWELSLLQRGHQDRHIPSPHAPRSPGSPGTNAVRCERPICIGGIRGSPRKRMAQALIKSTSNNKPPQQCAGSERAVRWQEPRGSSRQARAKPMDGTPLGCDAMNNCTDQQYWDALVCQCIPCSLICGRSAVRRCAALCESMVCNRKAGFYYDKLLKKCINCATVCGQHPKQCDPSCGSGALATTPPPPAALVTALPPAAALEQKACAEQEPWLVVYLLLGLCLCALICSLVLGWTHLRRKGEVGSCQAGTGTCHRREDSSKDRLVEAGSVGDGSTGSKVPEPVETCGFCFPGHGSAVQESKGHHSPSCPPGERVAAAHSRVCSTGSAGAIPSPDDGHFKIICSPSQEKTPMV
ncbi:tumor necrosis factor receptor superfamily member 13B isoform X1 [Anas acuta]|uniref:tumor necrosis factor receptor superfamily member 13B isoform X1 n=2 Tax=Anas acuta TaxID=28680 RepID=UPI0035C8C85C